MRVDFLPSPGQLSMGIAIRTMMAKAISGIEIASAYPGSGGKSSQAGQFDAFLVASRTAVASFIDLTVPAPTARAIRNSEPTKLYITHSEALDPKFVPPVTAFAIAGVTKVVSKVEVDGPFIILTVSVPWATGNVSTVAYTQPGATSNARDMAGNLLASYVAAAIVNGV